MTRDKILHLIAGAGIAGLVLALGQPPQLAFLAGLMAGAAKEVWDTLTGRGTYDPFDMLATAAGAAVVLWL